MIHTILVRPYVFVFLIVFLILSIRSRGFKPTLIFLVSGYLIAWASEASSIRTGFPYGWYFYIYENLKGELLNWGVPVWDSLSYVFLCFAGMSLAEYVYLPSPSPPPTPAQRGPFGARGGEKTGIFPPPLWGRVRVGGNLALLSAFFIMILDIIIDPLAHLGDQWFLGKIYYYPHPGFYFNVPLSNFAGWFAVSFVIVFVNVIASPPRGGEAISPGLLRRPCRPPRNDILGPLLYFGIFLFNWGITLWLKEWWLALADLFWISIPVFLLIRAKSKNNLLKTETI